jgi:hypothetical protein
MNLALLRPFRVWPDDELSFQRAEAEKRLYSSTGSDYRGVGTEAWEQKLECLTPPLWVDEDSGTDTEPVGQSVEYSLFQRPLVDRRGRPFETPAARDKRRCAQKMEQNRKKAKNAQRKASCGESGKANAN